MPSDTINIEPICKLAVFQQDLDLKPAPNLTLKLLEPSHFDKMKVSMALHVFSHSVSSAFRLMVEVEKWNNETLTTAWFVKLMDKWFNLMSSHHPVQALSKFSVEKYNASITFLSDIIELFQQIGNKSWKPVQTGAIISTQSVLDLQKVLLDDCNFKFFLTSRLSQDCLENLFSCIRSKNPVPTPLEFKHHLRLITVAQYLKPSENGSYEQDEDNMIVDFLDTETDASQDDSNFCNQIYETCFADNADNILSNESDELATVELNCLYNVAGYVLSHLAKKESCAHCNDFVQSKESPSDIDANITKLVALKEYRVGC